MLRLKLGNLKLEQNNHIYHKNNNFFDLNNERKFEFKIEIGDLMTYIENNLKIRLCNKLEKLNIKSSNLK